MRILRTIASANPKLGGPIEGIRQSVMALAELNCVNEIVCLDSPESPWLASLPFKTYALGPAITSYGYSKRLTSWLHEHAASYEAIIVHGLWQYPSFAVWRATRSKSVPYAVYPHGMLDPWFKRAYPMKHLKKSLYWPAEYRVLRDAKAVLFTSEEERRLARLSFKPYQCEERVINYGTSSPKADHAYLSSQFLEQFPHLNGKRIVLFLGRLHEKKGCDLLLDAFARNLSSAEDLHLVMAGPDQGEIQKQLLRQADRLGVASHITWPGMLTGDMKWGAFCAADVFALPSHQENFGIAVAEALACGLPVLISDKVNIWREILEDGAGLVASDTSEGIAGLLANWLSLSTTDRERMQIRARHSFENRFAIQRAATDLMHVLQSFGT